VRLLFGYALVSPKGQKRFDAQCERVAALHDQAKSLLTRLEADHADRLALLEWADTNARNF
jgi:hypothetical protein